MRSMGVPLPRLAALAARLALPVEEWPYLDESVLLKTRSRKVCMTCHWFRHHVGVRDIPWCSPAIGHEAKSRVSSRPMFSTTRGPTAPNERPYLLWPMLG